MSAPLLTLARPVTIIGPTAVSARIRDALD